MSHAIIAATRRAGWACLLLFCLVIAAAPQDASDPPFDQRRGGEPSSMEAKAQRERLKALNKDRFESLKRDTDRLLQLSTELKQSVDKASESTLSLEVIRKTEEVEKLAKKVREKMKAEWLMPGPSIRPQ